MKRVHQTEWSEEGRFTNGVRNGELRGGWEKRVRCKGKKGKRVPIEGKIGETSKKTWKEGLGQ